MTGLPTRPPSGWYPDPYPGGYGQLRWWDGTKWAPAAVPQNEKPGPTLDRTMAELQHIDARPWGVRPVLWPCIAVAGLATLGTVVTHLVRPHSTAGKIVLTVTANVLLYAVLAVVVWLSGREVAARYGGWANAFGLRRPRGKDIGPAAAGLGIAFAARIAVGIVAVAITRGRGLAQSENIHLNSSAIVVDLTLVLIAVILAPIIEETVFRGLLLRTFMRRLSFWPAAIASTVIFAGFHVYEVDTVEGAVILASVVATLGLTNCVLVRWTGRLVPGMVVHATLNALATAVAIYQAQH